MAKFNLFSTEVGIIAVILLALFLLPSLLTIINNKSMIWLVLIIILAFALSRLKK